MSFEGNWQLVINSPLGEHAASLSITETTESLAGSLTTEMGTVAVSGHANGDSVAFSARLPGPMGVMTLEFTGTVAESEVSGHIQVSGPIHPGPMGSARWRGARTEEEEVSQDATTMPRAPRIGHAAAHLGSLGGTGQGDGRPGSGVPGAMSRPPGLGLEALRSPAVLRRTFSSLRETSFRNLWLGLLLQMGGMQMLMLAGGYYIYELTGSPTLLGVVIAAAAVPALALALFGGVIADRMEKKRIIQAGQVVSLFVALFIAISVTTGTITWQHLLAASLVFGTVMPLMMPARQAIIPQLVGRERLMNAVALNSMGMSLTTMLAPTVAGGLIAALGIGAVYFIIAGMFAGAVLFTRLLPRLETEAGGTSLSVLEGIGEGIRYVFANRVILLLLLLSFATMVFAMPIRFILPIFAKDVLQVGPEGLGAMMSAMGVGSLGGTLVIASLGKVTRRGFALAASGILSGSILLGFAAMAHLAPVYWAALGFLVLVGLIQAGRMTLNNSLMMEYTDQEYRGRVMSLFTLNMGLMPAGVLPITLLADRIGAPLALGIMAALLILVSGAIVVASPRLRRLE